MKTNLKRNCQRFIAVLTVIIIAITSIPVSANAKEINSVSRYITVADKEMHVVFYGDISQTGDKSTFQEKNKPTLVMLPGLGEISPHLSFKPIAEALETEFNIVIVEPLGYGLSDLASTERTVENINKELNEALEVLEIRECILLMHSISGVYGLNFSLEYPEKVKGIIAIDNTIYDAAMMEDMEMEKEYMLKAVDSFHDVRNSFSSNRDFVAAITENPEKYGASLPKITGYTYPDRDMKEYIQAYSMGLNENTKSEITQMDHALLSIKGKKFADSLPVLMMVASANIERNPAWESAHRNQLNFESANHKLYILEGDHYIWHTNLTGIVEQIKGWHF